MAQERYEFDEDEDRSVPAKEVYQPEWVGTGLRELTTIGGFPLARMHAYRGKQTRIKKMYRAVRKEDGLEIFKLWNSDGLPFGSFDRLVFNYAINSVMQNMNTTAAREYSREHGYKKKKHRLTKKEKYEQWEKILASKLMRREVTRVDFLKQGTNFLKLFGYKQSGRNYTLLKESLERLINTQAAIGFVPLEALENPNKTKEIIIRFEKTDLVKAWDEGAESRNIYGLELGDFAVQSLIRSAPPISLDLLKQLRGKPLALDLCAWLCWRANKAPRMKIPLFGTLERPGLFWQFGPRSWRTPVMITAQEKADYRSLFRKAVESIREVWPKEKYTMSGEDLVFPMRLTKDDRVQVFQCSLTKSFKDKSRERDREHFHESLNGRGPLPGHKFADSLLEEDDDDDSDSMDW